MRHSSPQVSPCDFEAITGPSLEGHIDTEANPLERHLFSGVETFAAETVVKGVDAVHEWLGTDLPDTIRTMDATERVRALGRDAVASAEQALSSNPFFQLGRVAREAIDAVGEGVSSQVESMRDPSRTVGQKANSLGGAAADLGMGVMAAGQVALKFFQDGLDRHHRASLRAMVSGGVLLLEEMAKQSGIPKVGEGLHGYDINVSKARENATTLLDGLFEETKGKRLTQDQLYQATKQVGEILEKASNELHGKAVTQLFARARAEIVESPDFQALTPEEQKTVKAPVSETVLSRSKFEKARAAERRDGEIEGVERVVNQIHGFVASGLKLDAYDMKAAERRAQEAVSESRMRLQEITESK
jgi:hypothetical protein